jgi:hypothetical protein
MIFTLNSIENLHRPFWLIYKSARFPIGADLQSKPASLGIDAPLFFHTLHVVRGPPSPA